MIIILSKFVQERSWNNPPFEGFVAERFRTRRASLLGVPEALASLDLKYS